MIRFAENLNKMITAGLGGALEAPSTEVAVGHRVRYMEASGAVAGFETTIAAPIRSLRVDMQPIQAGSGDPSPDNIRPITGRTAVTVWREAVYDPSADPALTIQLGQTVYGGTLDVVSGKLTVDMAMVDFGTLDWGRYNFSGVFCFYVQLPNMKAEYPYGLCESYEIVISMSPARLENDKMTLDNGVHARYVYLRDDSFSDVAEFKAAMSGVMLCYELATPLEITLDPATLSTLKGDNNVWSDAGNISLEYLYYEETEGY